MADSDSNGAAQRSQGENEAESSNTSVVAQVGGAACLGDGAIGPHAEIVQVHAVTFRLVLAGSLGAHNVPRQVTCLEK